MKRLLYHEKYIQQKVITLKRISEIDDGTFGVLCDDDVPFAVTLEPNWRDNGKNSCIPNGVYLCKRTRYIKNNYNTFEVLDVPKRSRILLHKGNVENHSLGCILIAEQYETLNGKIAVLRSAKGFDEFMYRVKDCATFALVILDYTVSGSKFLLK